MATGTVDSAKASRLRATMERYFPEAMVTEYEPLIATMHNDAKDRHVAAVAVKAGAQLVTTANLKDFVPLPDGIEAQSPDAFLCALFEQDPAGLVALLREQAADLRNPPVSFRLLLDRLDRVVPDFVASLRRFAAT